MKRKSSYSFALLLCALPLVLWNSPAALAQVFGADVAGSCPAACNIKLRVTDAKISEANDGIVVVVSWALDSIAPEIKLSGFAVKAEVDLGIDRVRNTINVGSGVRSAAIKLSRLTEFDLKDVKLVHTEVSALAPILPPTPVTNILSRKVSGEGSNAAVEVTWEKPGQLPCSADFFDVKVAAQNEKGDRLTGNAKPSLSTRTARVELSGAVNKKGLRNPEANINVINGLIECVALKNFPPASVSQPAGNAVGSNGPETAKLTIKNFSLFAESGRVFTDLRWDAFEPTNFKTTQFDLKLEIEKANGQIQTQNQILSGNQRSFGGGSGIGVESEVRKVTVTVKATFRDNANTAVLTREDKKSAAFSLKQVEKPTLADKAAPKQVPSVVIPEPVKLDVTNLKIASAANIHRVQSFWQLQLPSGVTATSFEVEATVAGAQNKTKRSAVFPGNARQGEVSFSFAEVGNQVKGAQVKITANLKRANGSTFQQTATRENP